MSKRPTYPKPPLNFPGVAAAADDLVSVEIEESTERWNDYKLADGTTIRVKTVVVDISRSNKNYGPDGNPLYQLKTTIIAAVNAPASLRKKK